jgi:hypothetical protein
VATDPLFISREAYGGPCPRCGADLADPDHHLARVCNACGITVEAATVEVWDAE